jgi:hypothetical protein
MPAHSGRTAVSTGTVIKMEPDLNQIIPSEMVQLITDLPEHVAAYRASGAISKEEYDDVVIRRVEEVAAHFDQINFLVLLETGFDNYSLGAFMDYIKVSFEHFTQWNRMAIVTDEEVVRSGYHTLGHFVHGEIRTFPLSEYQIARDWVSAPFENE